MKKLLTSAGMVAVSVSGLQAAAYAPTLSSMESSKPWSVSAALRGFYDDNYTATAKKEGSFGYAVIPSVSLNVPLDQSFIGFTAEYGLLYYEDRPDNKFDQRVTADARIDHAFSERYKIEIRDSFVYSDEPEVISPTGGATASPLRTDEEAIRNLGTILFSAQLTELFGMELGYDNTFFNYFQDAHDVGAGDISRSALLDRIENLIIVDGRWQMRSDTVGILGYQFGWIDYTSDETIGTYPVGGGAIPSDVRNARSHYLYIGADHKFNSQLSASLRLGGQYYDNYNQDTDSLTPYCDASLTYVYNQDDYIQVGFNHSIQQTDVATVSTTKNEVTSDQNVSSLYASINHKITPNLVGSLLIRGQRGVFDNGGSNDDVEYFVTPGVNFAYNFNPHLSAETGYNFDWLDSQVPGRNYNRNRVYIGIRATY